MIGVPNVISGAVKRCSQPLVWIDHERVRLLDTVPTAPDSRTDPEAQLLLNEQLTSMVSALPSLTKSERTALVGLLDGESYERLALIVGGTPKAASQAAYRARRKLAAARSRAA